MSLTDLPMFRAIKSKMQWHQARQGVLAENVANADMPGYRARELKPFKVDEDLKLAQPGLETTRTQAGHLSGAMRASSGNAEISPSTFETTPDGNNVVLEEQMMKVTQNQMDFQAAASLYSRSIGLIKTAIGKSA
jgi:flagellar basal-body rod protein FlgB